MNHKEKAKQIYDKYLGLGLFSDNQAKQCALIAVDEILELDVPVMLGQDSTPFWQAVKAELMVK